MDYSFFDSLLDAVFVVDADRKIIYCNTAAASFCESSVRRLTKGIPIYSVLQLSDKNLFVMPEGHLGRETAVPITEIEFKNLISLKTGRVQINIQPFIDAQGQSKWTVLFRDVTLEEVLARKYRGELDQKEGLIRQLQTAKDELEQYSKNLEKMVEIRTAEVQTKNQVLNAIMNSLGQGFLTFDPNGICSDTFTKACLDILEGSPANRHIGDVLKLSPEDREQFVKWIQIAFAETLPFDNLIDLVPALFIHSQNRRITLEYYPLRDSKQTITNIVVVATDKTIEFENGLSLEREKQNASMVMRLIRNRDQFKNFLNSTKILLNDVHALSQQSKAELYRNLHTLEGEAAAYSVAVLRESARVAQDSLESDQFVDGLSHLKNVYNNFLVQNSELFEILGLNEEKKIELPLSKLHSFRNSLKIPMLQRQFDNDFLRVPILKLLKPLEEAAQVVALKQSKMLKPILFDVGEIEIFPEPYQELFQTLVHSIRNAVDHGIEEPFEREASAKPVEGQITIRAILLDQKLTIKIEDDGRGIDPEKIRTKLKLSKDLTDSQVLQHIFDAGFTSRSEVGEFSGRGIGMDAVSEAVKKLNGQAIVFSTLGKGTTLVLEMTDPAHQSQLQAA